MIIKSGDVRNAIPQANVAELVRLRAGEVATKIGHVKSAEVLRLRGSLLPLVRLDCAPRHGVSRRGARARTNEHRRGRNRTGALRLDC